MSVKLKQSWPNPLSHMQSFIPFISCHIVTSSYKHSNKDWKVCVTANVDMRYCFIVDPSAFIGPPDNKDWCLGGMLQKECAVNMSVLLNAAFINMYLVIKPSWQLSDTVQRCWMQLHFPRFEIRQKLFPRVSSTWPSYLFSSTLNDGKIQQEQIRCLMLALRPPVVSVLAEGNVKWVAGLAQAISLGEKL